MVHLINLSQFRSQHKDKTSHLSYFDQLTRITSVVGNEIVGQLAVTLAVDITKQLHAIEVEISSNLMGNLLSGK